MKPFPFLLYYFHTVIHKFIAVVAENTSKLLQLLMSLHLDILVFFFIFCHSLYKSIICQTHNINNFLLQVYHALNYDTVPIIKFVNLIQKGSSSLRSYGNRYDNRNGYRNLTRSFVSIASDTNAIKANY